MQSDGRLLYAWHLYKPVGFLPAGEGLPLFFRFCSTFQLSKTSPGHCLYFVPLIAERARPTEYRAMSVSYNGYNELETGVFIRYRIELYFSVVFVFDNITYDSHTKSCALTGRFGCKERIENTLFYVFDSCLRRCPRMDRINRRLAFPG